MNLGRWCLFKAVYNSHSPTGKSVRSGIMCVAVVQPRSWSLAKFSGFYLFSAVCCGNLEVVLSQFSSSEPTQLKDLTF
jgi:hypothetical protein